MTNLTTEDQGIGKWNVKCDDAFEKLIEAITNSPVVVSPDCSKPFRCHIDSSQTAVCGNLAQLDENGRDLVIAFYSKKLSPTESVYTGNDRELHGLISFLNRFRCYLDGTEFEVFTDNQVMKSFLASLNLAAKNRDGLKLLENLEYFQ